MTLDDAYISTHMDEVRKRLEALEKENAALREQITMSVQLSQGAKQWWQKLGLG